MENLYDSDFYSWAYRQARLIRQGRLSELDIDNLVEEIEDMGKSRYWALRSCISELLLHLLKWQMQARKDDQHRLEDWYRSWPVSIAKQRLAIHHELGENPGLNSKLDEIMPKSYQYARKSAAIDMECKPSDFPADSPWSFEQIMQEGWLPED